MLSLMLREGEYLMIGEDIRVCFLEDMSSKQMRIGIDAPKSIPILRNKPYEKDLNANAEQNATKLKEIEQQKQIHKLEVIKSKERAKERKRRAKETAEI